MNSRIELISDAEVVVQRNVISRNAVTVLLTSHCGVVSMVHRNTCDTADFDAEGRAALIDCLQCLRDTGSFAALADTSTSPDLWAGRMMRSRDCQNPVRILAFDDREAMIESADGNWYAVSRAVLSPLTPAPRVRPYTPVEAAAHLGRTIEVDGLFGTVNGKLMRVKAAGEHHFFTNTIDVPYVGAAKTCVWADDGTPCGIQERIDAKGGAA